MALLLSSNDFFRLSDGGKLLLSNNVSTFIPIPVIHQDLNTSVQSTFEALGIPIQFRRTDVAEAVDPWKQGVKTQVTYGGIIIKDQLSAYEISLLG